MDYEDMDYEDMDPKIWEFLKNRVKKFDKPKIIIVSHPQHESWIKDKFEDFKND